jgi:hypothetical protein
MIQNLNFALGMLGIINEALELGIQHIVQR